MNAVTRLALLTLACLAACSAPASTIDTMGEDETIRAAGNNALKLGKAGRLSDEPMLVRVTMVDSFGNESAQDALRFTWNAADVDRINWSNISGHGVLNLATPQILSREGVRSLGAWCVNEDGRTLTPVLCAEPYERAIHAFMSKPAS